MLMNLMATLLRVSFVGFLYTSNGARPNRQIPQIFSRFLALECRREGASYVVAIT